MNVHTHLPFSFIKVSHLRENKLYYYYYYYYYFFFFLDALVISYGAFPIFLVKRDTVICYKGNNTQITQVKVKSVIFKIQVIEHLEP